MIKIFRLEKVVLYSDCNKIKVELSTEIRKWPQLLLLYGLKANAKATRPILLKSSKSQNTDSKSCFESFKKSTPVLAKTFYFFFFFFQKLYVG